MAQGAVREAWQRAETALTLDVQCLDARLLANQAAFVVGDYAAALRHVEAGETHHPECPDFAVRRARYALMVNDVAQARAALEVAESKTTADTSAALWGMIGDAHVLVNQFDRAHSAYDRAIAADPDLALHRFNRGVVARYLGRTADAVTDFAAAVTCHPDYAEAWLNLVQAERQTEAHNRIAPISAVLERLPTTPASQRQRMQCHYALAKCYEDLGDGRASFAHVDAGARLMRTTLRYDLHEDLMAIDMIRRRFPPQSEAGPAAGYHGVQPIFVLGLPRSGSTLIERILTSHSDVGSVGESSAFGQALADVARAAGVDSAVSGELIRALPRLDPAVIGQRYAELTTPWRGTEPRFVDKLPNNHLYVGLIARALPRARIVHTVRHPLGNLYGMYKTLFNRAYPYSYNLDELVGYYAAYRKLMAHWQACLGPRLLNVSYEHLVDDPEPVIRQLVAGCGLDWQPACLTFEANRRPSTTQSAVQVRQALNREGVDGWRRFDNLLAPLRSRIEEIGVSCA